MPAANQTSHPRQAGTSRSEWTKAQRIVVKIGSALLADRATGAVRAAWLGSLADDIAALKTAGKQVIIVSSGAIAIGRHVLGLPAGTLKLEESQAAAAAGQIGLAHAYQEHFCPRNLTVAQVLLTLADTEVRRRYLMARNPRPTLKNLNAIPNKN
jgi:glutamate 5-kinase